MTPAGIAPGSRFGPYEIVGWLGAGGMGEVYRARDSRLGRDVAVKLIAAAAADPSRLRRFEQEARAAAAIAHPNILAVYDIGVQDGVPYIVSELLEGEPLRRRIEAGSLPLRKALDIARQTAVGLAAAHDKGIVHRDIKPDNLFIAADGHVKILDFGIAKLTAQGDEATLPGVPTATGTGTVIGTAAYMSPEQVRGEPVDARSDIFSLGVVLHEMLSGAPPFNRDTAAETMAAILKADPPDLDAPGIPPATARVIARCLEKDREARFQSARDLAFGLEVMSGTTAVKPAAPVPAPRRVWGAVALAVVLIGALAAAAAWLLPRNQPAFENPLATARFSSVTDFEGSELDAMISPDGKFVVFLSDRDGPFHVWLKQIGVGPFRNLTPGQVDQRNAGPNRSAGFSGDGGEIWLNGTAGRRFGMMPLMGGARRAFLGEHAVNAAWSPDGARLVYFTFDLGDAMTVTDRSGGNPRQIYIAKPGDHNHFPAWSPDGQWIYYVHGEQSVSEYDIWRIPPSGGTPQQLTRLSTDIRYLTPLDNRTLLYVAPDQDRSGPWLWALDTERQVTHRLSIGLERYLSVSASGDGRRLVATVSRLSAGLWTVPILDRIAEEHDVKPYPVPTTRSLAPRFGGNSLFFFSSSGAGDGLWRMLDGQAVEVWKSSDYPLSEAPAVSPAGDRVAVVVSSQGKQRLALVSADGGDYQTPANDIVVRGSPSWSPDAKWLVTGGSDAQGAGLFKVPVAGGKPVRLLSGPAIDPVWSPDGHTIVYAGQQTATAPLLAVRDDGTPVSLPAIRIPTGGRGRARFLADGRLVYIQGPTGPYDFWLLDLTTKATRQLTRLSSAAVTSTFDITPDGTHIVLDRVHEQSDIVLIELSK